MVCEHPFLPSTSARPRVGHCSDPCRPSAGWSARMPSSSGCHAGRWLAAPRPDVCTTSRSAVSPLDPTPEPTDRTILSPRLRGKYSVVVSSSPTTRGRVDHGHPNSAARAGPEPPPHPHGSAGSGRRRLHGGMATRPSRVAFEPQRGRFRRPSSRHLQRAPGCSHRSVRVGRGPGQRSPSRLS
jgi:hypothetical protein